MQCSDSTRAITVAPAIVIEAPAMNCWKDFPGSRIEAGNKSETFAGVWDIDDDLGIEDKNSCGTN